MTVSTRRDGAAAARVAALRWYLAGRRLDAALIAEPHDVRYLSGFRGDDTMLLIGTEPGGTAGADPGGTDAPGVIGLVCTDSRYWAQVAEEVAGFDLEKTERLPDDAVAALRRELGETAALGFQGGHTSYADWRRLRRLHRGPLRDLGAAVLRQRMVKDEEELRLLAQAAAIVDEALELLVAEGFEGRTEAEVAWRLETLMHELGAEGPSFETIVAAGPRAALAHAIPGERRIERGELVLIDAGARFQGYCSDITRTFAVGTPGQREREVYEVVLAAQLAGLAAARTGVDGRTVDAAARDVIVSAGYGDAFGHGTGHGVGLEVHELPMLGKRRGDRLGVGMVHTVEPGIYLEGELGVRIEDTVVVTAAGCERLTCSTKELREVD
jgi:Xaa-Pro aminopeptidase